MNLVFKRVGEADEAAGSQCDPRPMALHLESGEMLPRQISAALNSEQGKPLTLTVTFIVDGGEVSIKGDHRHDYTLESSWPR